MRTRHLVQGSCWYLDFTISIKMDAEMFVTKLVTKNNKAVFYEIRFERATDCWGFRQRRTVTSFIYNDYSLAYRHRLEQIKILITLHEFIEYIGCVCQALICKKTLSVIIMRPSSVKALLCKKKKKRWPISVTMTWDVVKLSYPKPIQSALRKYIDPATP